MQINLINTCNLVLQLFQINYLWLSLSQKKEDLGALVSLFKELGFRQLHQSYLAKTAPKAEPTLFDDPISEDIYNCKIINFEV